MPIDARTVVLRAPAPARGIPSRMAPHVDAIDSLLRPSWHPTEVRDNPREDLPVGRHYEVTQFSYEECCWLEASYVAAGWRVERCGGTNESWATRPEHQRRFLVFAPKHLVQP